MTTISLGGRAYTDPSLTFNISSVPQAGLNNRTIGVTGGLILGGSSGVNGLQVLRGQKEDYDRWGLYFGPESEWSWEGLLPYFKKVCMADHFTMFNQPGNGILTKSSPIYYLGMEFPSTQAGAGQPVRHQVRPELLGQHVRPARFLPNHFLAGAQYVSSIPIPQRSVCAG